MKKFGRKVYIKNPITQKEIGQFICRVCQNNSTLIERKGYGFKSILSICPSNHTILMDKKLYPKYHVGDVVRIYGTTFGKDSVIRLDFYDEGTIINSYPSILDYQFDMKIEKSVMFGKPLPLHNSRYNTVIHGHEHHRRDTILIKKAEQVHYEQLTLPLT